MFKLVSELYRATEFDEKNLSKTYIQPIESILKDLKSDLDSRPTEKWRIKLLLQALFNVTYPRFKEDKEATLCALATVFIEHICHCLEYPVHLELEVIDGVRVRPVIAHICNMLRNYAYSQNVFATVKDKELYDLWIASSAIPDFMKWLGNMVQVGYAKKEICIKVNESIDVFYENFYPPGIVRELDFVAKHFVSKQDLIKATMVGDEILGFLSKNVDYCAKVQGMKFES